MKGDRKGPENPTRGLENGACYFKSCQATPALWWGHVLKRWYCHHCARDLTEAHAKEWKRQNLSVPFFETRGMIDQRGPVPTDPPPIDLEILIEPLRDTKHVDWVTRQLEQWPNRVDPEKTTNITYLMGQGASLLRLYQQRYEFVMRTMSVFADEMEKHNERGRLLEEQRKLANGGIIACLELLTKIMDAKSPEDREKIIAAGRETFRYEKLNDVAASGIELPDFLKKDSSHG